MDFIIAWRAYETEYQGEPVSMQIHPLSTAQFMELSRRFIQIAGGGGSVPSEEDFEKWPLERKLKFQESAFDFQTEIKPIMEERVKDVKGFTINGQAPQISDLCNYPAFAFLVLDIAGQLIKVSQLDETAEKNSERPSTLQQ